MPRIPASQVTVGLPVAPSVSTSISPAAAAAPGRAIEQAGATIFDHVVRAETKIRSRSDAVARARAKIEFEQAVTGELQRLQTEGDLSAPETAQEFRGFVDKRMGELIQGHKGSADSRARLAVNLEEVRGEWIDRAAVITLAGQRKLVADVMQRDIGRLATAANAQPQALTALFGQLDAQIDDMAPALTPEEERQLRASGRERLVVSAVDSLITRGGIDDAERILQETPGLEGMLSPDTQQRIFNRINTARFERDAVMREIRVKEAILGRPLTQAELLAELDLAPGGPMVTIQGQAPAPAQGFQNVFDESGRLVRQEPIPGGPAAREIAATEQASAVRREQEVTQAQLQVRDIDTAIALIDKGAGGALEGSVPNALAAVVTPSTFDLQGQVDAIKGRIGFTTLQRMREASPTGGALGQVSQRELEALQAVLGALDVRNPARLKENLGQIRELMLDAWYGTPEEHQQAIEDGRLTEAQAAELQRQRETVGFDVMGRPVQTEATPMPTAAAGKPIAEMSDQELLELVNDKPRLQSLSDSEFIALTRRAAGRRRRPDI